MRVVPAHLSSSTLTVDMSTGFARLDGQSHHEALTLLVNPPLWNAYAPHLAVPLLTAVLKRSGRRARAYDLSTEALALLLSCDGMHRVLPRLEQRLRRTRDQERRREIRRALLLLPWLASHLDASETDLRRLDTVLDPVTLARSRRIQQDAMRCISAAFDGLDLDLYVNTQHYSANSSADVLAAVDDPERNVYRWVMEALRLPIYDRDLRLVGLSVSADTQLIGALTFAKLVKEARPDVHITMGGNFATRVASGWTAPHPFFALIDSLVMYEGEDAIVRLADAVATGGPLDDVPGLLRVEGESLRRAPPVMVDVSASPTPDFSDLPLGKYFAPGPIFPIFASRSCAWKCAFCSIPFASNKFRMRDEAEIVDEMDELHDRHTARFFMFVDEILTLRSLGRVSAELIARQRDYFWYGETRFAAGLNDELAARMYASGCRRLSLGLESYDQRLLDLMRKETRVEWIERNCESLLRAGIPINLFTISGFPSETPAERRKTVEFATRMLRRSSEEFNVPYSTWSDSPFVLDALSPVGTDPAAFDVEPIRPPASQDLALAMDFRFVGGTPGATPTPDAGGRVGGEPAIGGDWFHRPPRRDIEEVVFLRACLGAPTDVPVTRVPDSQPLPLHARVRLPPDVAARTWAEPLRDGRAPALSLYSMTHGRLLELPLRTDRDSAVSCLQHGEPVLASELLDALMGEHDDRAARIRSALRFGLLKMDAETLTRWAPSSSRITVELDVDEFRSSDGLVLRSRITGRAVRLSRAGVAIWDEWKRGARLDELDTEGPERRPGTAALLRQLVELGFLAQHPTSDPSRALPQHVVT